MQSMLLPRLYLASDCSCCLLAPPRYLKRLGYCPHGDVPSMSVPSERITLSRVIQWNGSMLRTGKRPEGGMGIMVSRCQKPRVWRLVPFSGSATTTAVPTKSVGKMMTRVGEPAAKNRIVAKTKYRGPAAIASSSTAAAIRMLRFIHSQETRGIA